MPVILTINSGSSSLKFSLYEVGASEKLLLAGAVERIGLDSGVFRMDGREQSARIPDHDRALEMLFDTLAQHESKRQLDAAGHRLVYGGREHENPQLITPELLKDLGRLTTIAPEHLPHELKAIQAVTRLHPGLAQVACFDTAFHCASPEIAKLYPLPRQYWEKGLMRYGFHGLSYAYIVEELKRERSERGRVIVAHLGNGASMAAIRDGKPVDTTMGFTPSGGLMMGTRSGDLDPGAVLYLVEQNGMSAAAVREIVNQKAGLLGVSGISSDMQQLLAKEASEPHAAQAIALFCYQAKKFLGALAAILGGLDLLVFTAGIGEHAPSIRARICEGLEWLGIHLDADRNQANAPVISSATSAAVVRVVKTNEELMLARHTREVLGKMR